MRPRLLIVAMAAVTLLSAGVLYAQDAPRLRADGLARFGGRFRAERRVLREWDDAAGSGPAL